MHHYYYSLVHYSGHCIISKCWDDSGTPIQFNIVTWQIQLMGRLGTVTTPVLHHTRAHLTPVTLRVEAPSHCNYPVVLLSILQEETRNCHIHRWPRTGVLMLTLTLTHVPVCTRLGGWAHTQLCWCVKHMTIIQTPACACFSGKTQLRICRGNPSPNKHNSRCSV